MINTPKQMAVWQRMKAENHPWYQQIIFNTTWDRYADQGRWELLRGLIDNDSLWMRKSYDELAKSLNNWTTIYQGNESREMTIEIAMMYSLLKDYISPAEDALYRNWLIQVADRVVGKNKISIGTRFSDSDQCTGTFLGIAMIDKVLGTKYLDGLVANGEWGYFVGKTNEWWPVGGLDATATTYTSMRNTVSRYCSVLAKGGHWIEAAGGYNEGTSWLLYSGTHWLGIEHFPEVHQFMKEQAKYLMHFITPDMKEMFQCGDVEHSHDMHNWMFYGGGDLLSHIQGMLDESDPDLAAMVRQFEEDLYSANNYVRNPLFARYYYFANPYAEKKPWREFAGKSIICEGQGHAFWRSGVDKATHVQFPSHLEVDHCQSAAFRDLMVWKDGKFILDRPLGYAPDQRYGNTLLVGFNVQPGSEGNGLVASAYDENKMAFATGTWCGMSGYVWDGAYGNLPTYNHETTGYVFELLDDEKTTFVVIDRVNAEDPKDQTLTNQWGTFGFKDLYHYEYQQIGREQITDGKMAVWHTPVKPDVNGNKITWDNMRLEQVFPANPKVVLFDEKAVPTDMAGYMDPDASRLNWSVRINQAEKKIFELVATGITDDPSAVFEQVSVGELTGVRVKRAGKPDVTCLVSSKIGPKLETTYRDNDDTHIKLDHTKLKKVVDGRKVALPVLDLAGDVYVADVTGGLMHINGTVKTDLPNPVTPPISVQPPYPPMTNPTPENPTPVPTPDPVPIPVPDPVPVPSPTPVYDLQPRAVGAGSTAGSFTMTLGTFPAGSVIPVLKTSESWLSISQNGASATVSYEANATTAIRTGQIVMPYGFIAQAAGITQGAGAIPVPTPVPTPVPDPIPIPVARKCEIKIIRKTTEASAEDWDTALKQLFLDGWIMVGFSSGTAVLEREIK